MDNYFPYRVDHNKDGSRTEHYRDKDSLNSAKTVRVTSSTGEMISKTTYDGIGQPTHRTEYLSLGGRQHHTWSELDRVWIKSDF